MNVCQTALHPEHVLGAPLGVVLVRMEDKEEDTRRQREAEKPASDSGMWRSPTGKGMRRPTPITGKMRRAGRAVILSQRDQICHHQIIPSSSPHPQTPCLPVI